MKDLYLGIFTEVLGLGCLHEWKAWMRKKEHATTLFKAHSHRHFRKSSKARSQINIKNAKNKQQQQRHHQHSSHFDC
jgi:hypothetical protein